MRSLRSAPHPLGTFVATSNSFVVVDPCHDEPTDGVVLVDVLPGTWHAAICTENCGPLGDRVAEMVVVHERASEAPFLPYAPFGRVEVDNGQVLITDRPALPATDRDAWYDSICELTDQHAAIVVAGGLLARTGLGDGAYPCDVARNPNGDIIAVRVDFFPIDNDGDEGDDLDDEEDDDEDGIDVTFEEDEDEDLDPAEADDELNDDDPEHG